MTEPRLTSEDFLLQHDITDEVLPKVGKQLWQMLYTTDDVYPHRFGMWCALLDEEAAAKAITCAHWDLGIDEGMPTFSTSWTDGTEETTYHRFGSPDGVRPLVLYRSFNGACPQYVEIDEEFRLFHNLAEDKDRGLLLSFDPSGREIEVVRIAQNSVQAQLKYLRQFQAAMGLHLAVYVDSVRYSQIRLTDVPENERRREEAANSLRWRRTVADCDFPEGFETFSRLLGKAILTPPAQEEAGACPFTEDNKKPEVMFIVGVDQNGNNVECTSNPHKLKDHSGDNSETRNYLTPVYFRREVLAKYYSEPERYSVSDGWLRCLNLWSCHIDNDLDSYIVVFLGDLGRDLPYEERLHWRQFNVPPDGGVSETNFRRSILAQPVEPKAPDLRFRHEYSDLMIEWNRAQGWPLFLLPAPGDNHLLETIRVPVTNSQAELDEQISHLTKLLVDSLNEQELKARANDLPKGTKGIGKLAGFLEATQFPQRQLVVQFLRDLQTLRSTGSAHRKGAGYDKIVARLGIQSSSKTEAGRRLLEEATAALRALRLHYCRQQNDSG